MKLIFLGTPDFAVPSLKKIAESGHEIVAVVTQPDRPRNRGVMTPSPVKETAIELGLKVLQYEKISREGISSNEKIFNKCFNYYHCLILVQHCLCGKDNEKRRCYNLHNYCKQ